jgi:hypothetical protein
VFTWRFLTVLIVKIKEIFLAIYKVILQLSTLIFIVLIIVLNYFLGLDIMMKYFIIFKIIIITYQKQIRLVILLENS